MKKLLYAIIALIVNVVALYFLLAVYKINWIAAILIVSLLFISNFLWGLNNH